MVKAICGTTFQAAGHGRLRRGYPMLDVFAGPHTGQHHADQYYTKHWSQHSLGADAFMPAWDVPHTQLRYQMARIFPPGKLIMQTLQRLIQQPVHATLVLPDRVAAWTALLKRLPVIYSFRLFPTEGVYSLGASAPKTWSADKSRPLMAWRLWPGCKGYASA